MSRLQKTLRQACCAALGLSLACGAGAQQQLVIGQGSALNLGSGSLDIGCRDLAVNGNLAVNNGTLAGARHVNATGAVQGGTGTLAFSGDLSAVGTLQPESGTVRSQDGCGTTVSRIQGVHQFFRFVAQSDLGRQLIFPAGATQDVAGRIELIGGAARLLVRSSALDSLALIRLASSATWFVNRIDARDVGATPDSPFIAPLDPVAYDSIDRGNTPRLLGTDGTPVPVPTQSGLGALLMALLLVGVGTVQLRAKR